MTHRLYGLRWAEGESPKKGALPWTAEELIRAGDLLSRVYGVTRVSLEADNGLQVLTVRFTAEEVQALVFAAKAILRAFYVFDEQFSL